MPWTTQQKRDKYRADRNNLIYYLGGKCAHCGSKENLEFDHLGPKDWEPEDLNRWTRLKRYEKEYDKGKIQLLCSTCNKKKGTPGGSTLEEIPE